jgi:hypothetical protein
MAIAAAADKRNQPAAIQTSSRGNRQLHLGVVENLKTWGHGLDGNGVGWAPKGAPVVGVARRRDALRGAALQSAALAWALHLADAQAITPPISAPSSRSASTT